MSYSLQWSGAATTGRGKCRDQYHFYFADTASLLTRRCLDRHGQLQALTELQGQYFAHGPTAEAEGRLDSVVMRPREFKAGQNFALSWSVGQKIGYRSKVDYDPKKDEVLINMVDDPSLRYADFISIPRLGVMAVDDRVGENHMGGKAAINRFRSIFRNIEGGAVNVELTTTPQDVAKAMKQWELTEFSFVVRPYNPHPPGELSKMLSDQFEKDGIGRYTAKARPRPGKRMKAAPDGHIASVVELADAGYGQYAVRGIVPEGHEAQIKRPPFEAAATKNQKRQAEPRELRVMVAPPEEKDEKLFEEVAKTLVRFYGTD